MNEAVISIKNTSNEVLTIDIPSDLTKTCSDSLANLINDKKASQETIQSMISLIDLTTLNDTDTVETVTNLCKKALNNTEKVAAICVFPSFVSTVEKTLGKTDNKIQLASVATGFPHGQIPLELQIAETEYAIKNGATEIDMVIHRGDFLNKQYQKVFDHISNIKKTCDNLNKNVSLKVILETGQLQSLENIYIASLIAIHAGANFIKTSTGKSQPTATLEAAFTMLTAIKDSNTDTGFKASGGIRTTNEAYQYYQLAENTLGKEYLSAKTFRFGASQLLDNLLNETN